MGYGPGVRSTSKQWEEAKPYFLNLIELIRPRKVIVTGIGMWKAMPDCDAGWSMIFRPIGLPMERSFGASDCLTPQAEPKGRGFAWESVAASIKLFRDTAFPLR